MSVHGKKTIAKGLPTLFEVKQAIVKKAKFRVARANPQGEISPGDF